MANLSILELIDKIKAINTEKDQIIKNLQEKLSIVETEVFKKESVVRGLREEILNHAHETKSPQKNSVISSGSMLSIEKQNN